MEVSLNEIGEIITGNTPSKSDTNFWDSPDICFIKPDVIAEDEITELLDSNEYISENARNKARIVNENSILVTCIGSIAKIGIVKIRECAFNQQINAIIPDKNIDTKYLCYCLQNSKVKLKAIANAPVVPIINKKQFGEFVVKIDGDISIQKKIANRLDHIQSVIKLYKIQLRKFDDLIKARFIEMFGDPVSNSKHLPLKTLPQLGTFGRGVSKYRPRNAPELLNGPYPLIQTGDIANSELYIKNYNNTYSEVGLKQSKMWDKGTLCITIAANIAKPAILQFDACFPDSVVGFNGNNLTDNIFVHYWFSFFQEILENQAPESAQKNINLKILSELQIITPDIIEQNQFADFVHQVDKSRFDIKKSITELEREVVYD
jgi:type I restriction enzyme S subunit